MSLHAYLDEDGVLRKLGTPIYVPDPEGLMVAIGVLLDNAKREGAPMHLALPIAAIQLSLTEPPDVEQDEEETQQSFIELWEDRHPNA